MSEIQTGGRLAQVIATRGGLAPPEAPLVIEHREALYYMLCEAAELEHGIMCQYLYAAFSLKQSEDEGLSAEEAEAVRRWRKRISHVATQEMLHLSLVQNLLAAIGGAPHLSRPNFPHPGHPLPGRRAPGAAAVRRARAPALHVPGAPGGDGPGRRGGDGRLRPRDPGHDRRRDRPPQPGLQDRRAPVPVHRGRVRAPGRQVRRAAAVRRPAAGPGHPAVLRLARAGRGDRHGQRAESHRRDPRAGRGPARELEGRALRPVRPDHGRVHPAPRGQPGLPAGPAGGHGQRQAERARHRRPAGHRPADQAGHGPVQRQLRGSAAHAAALLRPHRGDRRPAQGPGRRHRQPHVPGHQADRRPGHHAPRRPGLPGPHGRPQLRAVLRVRHRAPAPGGRLDPAHRAHPPGRRVLRARRPLRPRGRGHPGHGPLQPDRDRPLARGPPPGPHSVRPGWPARNPRSGRGRG